MKNLEMPRIYDYNSFSSGKNKSVMKEFSFSAELDFLEVEIVGRPAEISDIDSKKCEIDYELSLERQKSGLSGINFVIKEIELELKVDDYPNDPLEFEFDIVPGENIEYNSVVVKRMEKLIPSSPSLIRIDMKKSMNVKDFKIEVYFGSDD
jgi:hypothetical protein